MEQIRLDQPKRLVFGNNVFDDFIVELQKSEYNKILVITDSNILSSIRKIENELLRVHKTVLFSTAITSEPSSSDFNEVLYNARKNRIDAVVGIGGGSIMDVAKLVAALYRSKYSIEDCFDNHQLDGRDLFLACIPTTSGTGSEVSPNAILFDEKNNTKKGIISPFLVPDMTFIDPVLTHSLPPQITAATGLDAFVHCLEAYTNKNAHPVIDLYALEGMRLIYENLEIAYLDGKNQEARSNLALGSYYGGLCLGPVNTAAIHALAYPLGSLYKIPHGISNAILMPYVLSVNLDYAIEKYAKVAITIGCEKHETTKKTAQCGLRRITSFCRKLNIPEKLTSYGISIDDVEKMAESAYSVQRLLKNNPYHLDKSGIIDIYNKLL
jgi:alcohol dehydrogenase class IV